MGPINFFYGVLKLVLITVLPHEKLILVALEKQEVLAAPGLSWDEHSGMAE